MEGEQKQSKLERYAQAGGLALHDRKTEQLARRLIREEQRQTISQSRRRWNACFAGDPQPASEWQRVYLRQLRGYVPPDVSRQEAAMLIEQARR